MDVSDDEDLPPIPLRRAPLALPRSPGHVVVVWRHISYPVFLNTTFVFWVPPLVVAPSTQWWLQVVAPSGGSKHPGRHQVAQGRNPCGQASEKGENPVSIAKKASAKIIFAPDL